jgi:hypothetical protein
MSEVREVREALARAAAQPRMPVDYDEIDRRARARGRRRTRLRVAGVSLAAATAVAGAVVVAPRDDHDVRPAPAVPVTGAPWIENRLPASVRTAGGRALMPLVLPDGTRVELSLPRGVDWGGMPVVPYGGVELPGVFTSDFHVLRGGLAYFASEGRMERELFSAPGRVATLWTMHTPGGPGRYVVVDFGSWVIGIWGASQVKTDQQLQTIAENFTGTVTDDGFLVLRPTGPLRLLGAGSGAAPAVEVGDPAGLGLTVAAEPCTTDASWVSGTAAEAEAGLCRPAWGVTVRVHGPRDVVDSVRDAIDVRRTT